jgi:hypothetical protein
MELRLQATIAIVTSGMTGSGQNETKVASWPAVSDVCRSSGTRSSDLFALHRRGIRLVCERSNPYQAGPTEADSDLQRGNAACGPSIVRTWHENLPSGL